MIDQPKVREINDRDEAPEREPDFIVEGSFETVREECALDYATLPIFSYIGLKAEEDVWCVWQIEKGGSHVEQGHVLSDLHLRVLRAVESFWVSFAEPADEYAISSRIVASKLDGSQAIQQLFRAGYLSQKTEGYQITTLGREALANAGGAA